MRLVTLIFALSVFIHTSLSQTFNVNLLTNPSAESTDGWNGYTGLNGYSYSPPDSFLIRGDCWQIIDLSAYENSINGGHLSIAFGGAYATEEDSSCGISIIFYDFFLNQIGEYVLKDLMVPINWVKFTRSDWGKIQDSLPVPLGTSYVEMHLVVYQQSVKQEGGIQRIEFDDLYLIPQFSTEAHSVSPSGIGLVNRSDLNEDGIVNKLDLLLLQSVWNTISEVEIPTPTTTPEIQPTPTPLSQETPIPTHPFTGVYQAVISGDDFGSGSFTVDQYGKISGSTTTNNGFISLGGVIALDGSITFSYSDGVSLIGVGVGKVNDDGIGNGSWINIMGGRGTWHVTKQ